MVVIACIDNNLGMMFNNRRQSRDKAVTEKIIDISKKKLLMMSSYSYEMFADYTTENICVDDNFMSVAKTDTMCFLEGQAIKRYENKIEKIILFKWNRNYPSDCFLDIDLRSGKWKLISADEFAGSSHDKITMEVYTS